MNRRTLLGSLCVLPLLSLTACSGANPPAPSGAPASDLLAAHDLAGRSAVEVVEALEADPGPRPLALRASVKPDRVELADATAEQVLTLPDDLFYLSIAPYGTRTHECFHHNLGSCQGELVDTELTVRIIGTDGRSLVAETVRTHANGFVGFWLPRGIRARLEVAAADGRRAGQDIGTSADDPTCLTTLQLV